MLDEVNEPASPGETIAVKEVLSNMKYKIKKSQFIPDRSILIVK